MNSAKVLNIRAATWQMEEKQNVSYLKRAKNIYINQDPDLM